MLPTGDTGVDLAAGKGYMQGVEMWRRGWREGVGAGGLERAGVGMCWRRAGERLDGWQGGGGGGVGYALRGFQLRVKRRGKYNWGWDGGGSRNERAGLEGRGVQSGDRARWCR